MSKSLRAYIEERCTPIPFAGCWMWLLSLGSHGYGQAYTTTHGVTVAHRLSYIAFKGPIPSGMLVQHSCDQKWCVNPDHLSIGTDATNAADKQTKGRAAKKLTPDIVRAIRRRLIAGGGTFVVAREFGVNQRLVYGIKQGRIWNHIESVG